MMTRSTILLTVALLVAACGGSDSSEQAEQTQPTEQAQQAETTAVAETTTTTEVTARSSPLDEVMIEPADSGPRPLLSWTPVDGAATYRVIVLSADGTPHWAWTGAETQINVGGFADPSLPGAIVFEPMTWSVAALDGEGLPLAMSAPSPLNP